MRINRKIILLLGVLFLMGGILISYGAFYINGEKHKLISKKSGEEIIGWVAQNLEHRLLQLEASTSYLDQSTVESLKRLGSRYFAYVYKNRGEWSVKWKKLGFLEKEKILEEVNEIDFSTINSEKRTWHFNGNRELIYIAPVALAKSHQLYEGFLVFGLKGDFFKFISSGESSVIFLTEKYEALKGDFPSELENKKKEMTSNQLGMKDLYVKERGKNLIFISYFSPLSQLWVVHRRNLSSLSYFESLFFYYFLISTCLVCLFLLLFNGKFISFSFFKKRENFEDQVLDRQKDPENGTIEEVFPVDQNSKVLGSSSENQKDEWQPEPAYQIHAGESSPGEENRNESEKPSSAKPVFSLKSEGTKKEEKSLAEIEKKVEKALEDFQLKKFDFEDPQTNESTFEDDKYGVESKKPVEVKTRLKRDEHGLFEFDNGQTKFKIRPPKKKDGNVNY